MPVLSEKIFNLPNLLSAYRLVMAPVLVVLALSGARTYFVVFLAISFMTDLLDGFIARAWNQRTSFGSRLDSIADEMTYVAALTGAFQFEYQAIRPHAALLYAFIFLLVLATFIPLVKFREIPSFHLYSFKINAFLQAVFFFCLFVLDFYPYLFYPIFAFGILACIESIAISLLLDQPVSDARGIYWVLRYRRGRG